MQLTIKDEDVAGKILNEITVALKSESLKVQDIIEARVTAEVEAWNNRQTEYYNGLVQPEETERTLNGFKFKKGREKKTIDAEAQVYIALDAFNKNGYFMLIDNLQAESLEQEVLVTEDTRISFIRLTPLVGG